jgi:hypothetical protein
LGAARRRSSPGQDNSPKGREAQTLLCPRQREAQPSEPLSAILPMADRRPAADEPAATAPRAGAPLTKRESRLLEYLIEYLTANTYQPSLREICRALRLKSTKTASELIQRLAEKRYVELPESGSRPARGIRIVGIELTIRRTLVPPNALTAGGSTNHQTDAHL